jgi:alginate O-acetyltransferase complex protein AlgJ
MKCFLKKLGWFLLPLGILVLLEGVWPFSAFSYRPWEALKFSKPFYGRTYYGNEDLQMTSFGDLCHHTDQALPKQEHWITDSLGYRNDTLYRQPDVLFIGDSFVTGTSLDQPNTLSNRLMKEFHHSVKVYNMAPSDFSTFDALLSQGELKKPRVIIFSMVETLMPTPLKRYEPTWKMRATTGLIKTMDAAGVTNYVDRCFRFYSLKWLKARMDGAFGQGWPGAKGSSMYFLHSIYLPVHPKDMARKIALIRSYKAYCDSLNIRFVFLPMPAKESVYYEQVPFKKQPSYFHQMDSTLQSKGICVIPTLAIYNQYRSVHDSLLYQLDDSHWNARAVGLISKKIKQVLLSEKLL